MPRQRDSNSSSAKSRSAAGRAKTVSPSDASPNHNLGWFTWFAHETARLSGRPATFMLAAATIVVWGVTGPIFNFSDTWQLVINTGTTIVTFLMVFLIQNSQNRDARATHLKLDELIHSINAARNGLIDIEDCTDEELDRIKREFDRLRQRDSATKSKETAR